MLLMQINSNLEYLIKYGSLVVEDEDLALQLISILSRADDISRYELVDDKYYFEIGAHLAN